MKLLPIQRGIQAAANEGSTFTFTPRSDELAQFKKSGIPYKMNKDGTITLDFTGLGSGNTQAKLADQSAQSQLALSQKYDPQFIASALKEEQLANPQGAEARGLEQQLIQKQINTPSVSPTATTLTNQVENQLNAGKGLDDMESHVLNGSVAQALSDRGDGNGQAADWAEPLTTGAAGNQRQMAGIQKATGLLSSGVTPGDVNYRHEQQNLANLSEFNSGQTPTSEFSSLSGAQNGPTPNASTTDLPLLSNPLGSAASGAAQQYQNQVMQPNGWMTGATALINGATGIQNAASNFA